MISKRKIMTSYARSLNLTIKYHHMVIECYKFFKRKRIFLSFKILNEKMELQVLNTCTAGIKYILKVVGYVTQSDEVVYFFYIKGDV